jgi:hypothetical protein
VFYFSLRSLDGNIEMQTDEKCSISNLNKISKRYGIHGGLYLSACMDLDLLWINAVEKSEFSYIV